MRFLQHAYIKRLGRFLLAAIILAVLAVGAGFAAAYFTGNASPKAQKKEPVFSYSPPPAIKPKQVAENASEGVAIQSMSTPIKIGSTASLYLKTNPTSVCSPTVNYRASRPAGLEPKTANEFGLVDWQWTIDASVPAGAWRATITCVYKGRSGVGTADFQVTPR